METILFIIIACVITYVITSSSIGNLVSGSSSETMSHSNKKKDEEESKQLMLPEDSTLRRHFLSMLRVDVESSLAPFPTCFIQKRHHETLIQAEIANRLQS